MGRGATGAAVRDTHTSPTLRLRWFLEEIPLLLEEGVPLPLQEEAVETTMSSSMLRMEICRLGLRLHRILGPLPVLPRLLLLRL